MGKTFKQRYDEDPKFKKNHNIHMSTKVKCKVCGSVTARSNMSKHTYTGKHIRALENNT